MQILVHIGLNKCASTHIQHALDAARADLAANGTFYPDQPGPPCQYGLSKFLGFGPFGADIPEQSIDQLVAGARAAGCRRLIVSSEYLSLWNPAGVARFLERTERMGASVQILMISRDPIGWIRSQFNQYVRTVQSGGLITSIDTYIDRVLANGAFRIDQRVAQWQMATQKGAFAHYRMDDRDTRILAPFSVFSGMKITLSTSVARNSSLDADRLYRIAVLRQEPSTRNVEDEIANLLAGAPARRAAPEGYLSISPAQMIRLKNEIVSPYRALPITPWPKPGEVAKRYSDRMTV